MTRYILSTIVVLIIALGGWWYVDNAPTGMENGDGGEAETIAEEAVAKRGVTLDLSDRGLSKVPEYVFGRTDIETLDLSGNNLTGALQAEVRHLKNLRTLDLSDNKFTGVPAEIGQLEKLEVLDLSNNMLTGLPYELGNLRNLKMLDLSGNDYSELDLAEIRKKLSADTTIKTQ